MTQVSAEPQIQEELKQVRLSQIVMNPYQPRREFKSDELEDLAQSIRSVGIIHPPLVRPLPDSDTFELISGERRFRAAQLAELETIPVYVRKTSYSISAQAALIENVQRVDLNALEIAKALKRLMIDFEFSQEAIAQQIGKNRSTVANYLRLLTLPLSIQESISQSCITMGHAKAILALDQEDRQLLLHELILRDEMSVREAEQAAGRISEKAKRKQLTYATRDFHLEEIANKIRERLGTKVLIQAKGKRGRISIDYYGYEDLDRLLSLLGVKSEN